ADMFVWVLDPQKYADAAIHDRYLAPMRTHADVMVVVLNHIDTVPEDRRDAMVDDVRRLLAADGIPDVPVIAISARHGIGIDQLKGEIEKRVADKRMTAGRIEADVRAAAGELRAAAGDAPTRTLSDERVEALESALAEGAGVPAIVEAVERSTRWRAGRATGWPLVSWVGRLRPDPLKKLEIDLGADSKALRGQGVSVPQATAVQRARIDAEVRSLADDVSTGLGAPFADSVRRASTARLSEVGDRLDDALRTVDLDAERLPVWAGAVRVLQWLLVLAALVGGAWSVAAMLSGGLGDLPRVGGVALPLVLLGGGVLLGVLLGLVCRGLVAATARSRAGAADRRVRAAVAGVAAELVVAPVQAELTAYTSLRTGLDRALA
ncbi:MAG: ABC transporter, partial [Actinomycetota bacterium]|nr:ABC transporter [Actinomycetota bacterium]